MQIHFEKVLERSHELEKELISHGFAIPGDHKEGTYYLSDLKTRNLEKHNIIHVEALIKSTTLDRYSSCHLLLSKVTKEEAMVPEVWYDKTKALIAEQPSTGAIFLQDIEGLVPVLQTKDKILKKNMNPEILILHPVYKAIWTGSQWEFEFDEDFHIGVDK